MLQELKTIVGAMTSNNDTFKAIFGTNSWQNVLIDEAMFPIVAFDLPTVNYILPKSSYIGETYPITIFVAYKSELDWDGEQHEVVLELANTAMREMISRLQTYRDADGNSLINTISFVSASRVRCVFDVCCTGIMAQFVIEPYINLPVCV